MLLFRGTAAAATALIAIFALVSADIGPLRNSNEYSTGRFGRLPQQRYISSGAVAPVYNLVLWADACEDGLHVFFTPRCTLERSSSASCCPTIMDAKGSLVWMTREYGQVNNLNVQQFQGRNFLTFWGKPDGEEDGRYYLLNSTYDVVYKFKAVGSDVLSDFHEWRITEKGTALVTVYKRREADLAHFGRSEPGWIWDCGFQEIDIATGKLVFEWWVGDHWAVTDSLLPPAVVKQLKTGSEARPVDVFHINSIHEDALGNYLISARHTSTISYISGRNGSVLWNLGGKYNNFTFGGEGGPISADEIGWQHHVRWESADTIRLFNNNASQFTEGRNNKDWSSGLVLNLDKNAMTASLARRYTMPGGRITSTAEGGVQRMENGDALVNWGSIAMWTQYNREGDVKCHLHYGPKVFFGRRIQQCYRVYKKKWVGKPTTTPDMTIFKESAFMSWNGATEIDRWVLYGSPVATGGQFKAISSVRKTGFETQIELPAHGSANEFAAFKAKALDAKGAELGETNAVPYPRPRIERPEPRRMPGEPEAKDKTPPPSHAMGIDQIAPQTLPEDMEPDESETRAHGTDGDGYAPRFPGNLLSAPSMWSALSSVSADGVMVLALVGAIVCAILVRVAMRRRRRKQFSRRARRGS